MTDLSADPIFSQFPLWEGRVPAGLVPNFVGQVIDVSFTKGWDLPERMKERYDRTTYPMISEELFEWRLMLSAVLDALESFTMIEAGAGYGRWLVSAACACRALGRDVPLKLMAIEGDPVHFGWIAKHFRDNGIDPNDHHLIRGAVHSSDGEVKFWQGGDATAWYGQMVVKDESETYPIAGADICVVPAFSVGTLLRPFNHVDLMDFDIQGAEKTAIPAAIGEMTRKVKRVFVETHGPEIHEVLARCFSAHGWICDANHGFAGRIISKTDMLSEEETIYGTIRFQGGVQCWVNPLI